MIAYEAQIYTVIVARLTPDMQARLDALLVAAPVAEGELPLSLLRLDPGPVGVESALSEIAKLRSLRAIGLPPDLIQGYAPKLVERLRRRIAEKWNGTKWKVIPSANPGTPDRLYRVKAITAKNIWAVGALVWVGASIFVGVAAGLFVGEAARGKEGLLHEQSSMSSSPIKNIPASGWQKWLCD